MVDVVNIAVVVHLFVQWNDFSEDNSVADSHDFNIMCYNFQAMVGGGEYLREFPIPFIFLYEQKWVTTPKFGERLAYWPLG